jgi:hypothetical protein
LWCGKRKLFLEVRQHSFEMSANSTHGCNLFALRRFTADTMCSKTNLTTFFTLSVRTVIQPDRSYHTFYKNLICLSRQFTSGFLSSVSQAAEE